MQVQLIQHTTDIPAAVHALYESSFPATERRPWHLQTILAATGSLQLASVNVQHQFGGMVSWWLLPGFVFIEHIAVRETLRGQGIGAAVIQLLQQQYRLLVLESEHEHQSPFAKRRIGFYQKLGFTIFPYPYLQPPYTKDAMFVPMHLLHSGSDNSEAGFRHVKEMVYRKVYGVKGSEGITGE
ncbi:GNAT family N-acetyltransferase [Deminuibacter soli]|uniref:N-acetyltransferase n=1 Tax=Deminuibacter soli TaxID=2291815 RepID=A0A3E1NHB5_9BACT|nr:GNAT family N-acetyltransferase [Deminuibacter soli]RFM27178.1 N-acetyltransferase [Deminuibacter soli]